MPLQFHKASRMGRRLAARALGLCVGLAGAAVLAAAPARASETLSFSYGPLIRSL